MKPTASLCIVTCLVLLGCRDADRGVPDAEYDSMLQFQVGHTATREGATRGSGGVHVAATCHVPVPSQGGPGHVLSYCGGLLVEMKWSGVRPLRDSPKPGLVFSDLRWRVGNRLMESSQDSRTLDGWHGPIEPGTSTFTEDYRLLVTPVSFRHTAKDAHKGPFLMVRARWQQGKLKPPDIQLREKPRSLQQ